MIEVHTSAPGTTFQFPLDPKPGHTQYTPTRVIRRCGPIDLFEGDVVSVFAREQLDNENRYAGGAWTEYVVHDVYLEQFGKIEQQKKPDWQVAKVPWYKLNKKRWPTMMDPRWTLWVGANLGVIRSTDENAISGKTVIRETGENFDNWVHHWRWADGWHDVVTADAPSSYYLTTCWLDTNPTYRLPGQTIEVTYRGGISAAVTRGG